VNRRAIKDDRHIPVVRIARSGARFGRIGDAVVRGERHHIIIFPHDRIQMIEEAGESVVEADQGIQLLKASRSVPVPDLISPVHVDGEVVDGPALAKMFRLDRSRRQCQERLVF
jgi:hypothetical protein